MADIKQAYGTSTAITCTLGSLASQAARCTTSVANSSNYMDAMVYVAVKNITTTGPDNVIYVYAYGSEDGTNYGGSGTAGASPTGADEAYATTPSNLNLIGTIATGIFTNTTFKAVFGSLNVAFGGVLPRNWGLVIDNRAGTLSASGHTVTYTGIYSTSA